jgi:hypothetical protein
MIRDVVIHLLNEQPVLADLYEMPKALDQGLLCTNLRTMDGKRPVFVAKSDAIFFFPYLHVRFVEVLTAVTGMPELEAPGASTAAGEAPAAEPEADTDLELDEDFLRRIRDV